MAKYLRYFFWCICVVTIAACSNNTKKNEAPTPAEELTNRGQLLSQITYEMVIPGYANFKVKLDAMQGKSDAFSTGVTKSALVDLRQAWVEAYTEWEKVELYAFGPADKHSLRSFMNIYPTNETTINANITSGTANLDLPANYPAQGFPALDFLLNGVAADDDAIVAYYSDPTDGAKRIAYLKLIATQMNNKFTTVQNEWKDYKTTYISKTGTDLNSSLSLTVNAYVLNYERYIRSGKFGIPSGAMVGGIKNGTKVEAFYKKDISKVLAKTAHQASIDFFNGKSVKTGIASLGFKSYLDTLNAKDVDSGKLLSVAINERFSNASDKINLLGDNFYDEVQNNNQKMIDVYDAMQLAVGFLKVDMTSAMSITITYTDNDGD